MQWNNSTLLVEECVPDKEKLKNKTLWWLSSKMSVHLKLFNHKTPVIIHIKSLHFRHNLSYEEIYSKKKKNKKKTKKTKKKTYQSMSTNNVCVCVCVTKRIDSLSS